MRGCFSVVTPIRAYLQRGESVFWNEWADTYGCGWYFLKA